MVIRYFILRYLVFALIFSFGIAQRIQATEDFRIESAETELFKKYTDLLENKVIKDLSLNHDTYLKSPNEYWRFLDRTFLKNWDFDATTRALIGAEIYYVLSESQFNSLSKTLEVTLIRYAFESLPFYFGQQLKVLDIKLDKKNSFSWLKINMKSSRLPDIHLDLLLKRTTVDYWKGVDFRFKGITYVNLKKSSYREKFHKKQFVGLLDELNRKNEIFFTKICQRNANYLDPSSPPCIENHDKK